MKRLKRFKKGMLWLLGVLTIGIVLVYLFDVNYLLKAVRTIYFRGYKTAYLEDYKVFDTRVITKAQKAEPWAIAKNYNETGPTPGLEKIHQELKTVAFLIIKNDSIWHEHYFEDYGKESKSNSFSMAKSIVSATLGKAIMQGEIKGLDQPVSDFFPEFSQGLAAEMTVGDLSSMSSGLDWDEAYYSPFSVTTKAYFYNDLKKLILGLKVIEKPGQQFKYLSGNTELLAMVIEKATGMYLSDYVSKHFWQQMGMEQDALWQVDHPNGIEKAYCCIASNARDFARFGKLYKQEGNWNGKQILDADFVKRSITPRFFSSPEYGYGWWLSDYLGKTIFYMRGHLGQFVIVIPQDDLIIVRLGHIKGHQSKSRPHSDDFYQYIEETYKMLNNVE